ncbi:MAG: MBL fold metallo-hydrolase [Bacteriovoracaceae bacterium]|nr:MBL fold metallo-hydrolase [Bacteriovoracaceae bacterium]
MKLKIWGSRGSIPVSPYPQDTWNEKKDLLLDFHNSGLTPDDYLKSKDFNSVAGYGGNTTCVQVTSKSGSNIIIDGGSGIRPLGMSLLGSDLGKGQGEAHIYLTHYHWDHLVGLPFFVPFYIPGNKIHVYSVCEDLEEVFEILFKKPYFPVPFNVIKAQIVFHQIEPRKEFKVGDLKCTPYQLDHPDPCWGLKVNSDDKNFAHCVDTEGTRISRDKLGDDLPLYQGIDLMYFDAQYDFNDHLSKVDWGHSASQIGLDLAMREGIKKVLFTHHDPAASDAQITDLKKDTQRYFQEQRRAKTSLYPVEWDFAYDGLVVEI